MGYLVLARKYRPEQFSEIVGQEHITRTLINAIEQDRLHHAYLFCGIRGLGKTTAARILAKCLTCEQAPTTNPCGTCRQCVGIRDGSAVDVMEIDGASNNSVDDVRQLREQVHHLPLVAKRKVYIIDEVHMMSTSAFNALLKTLEEPPPHVTFIFATTDPHKVIETILSRVSRFDFRRVRPEPMVTHLREILAKEGMSIEEEGVRMVARASDGSVRDALTFLDKVIAFAADPTEVSSEEVRMILGQVDRFAVGELVDAVLARDASTTLQRFDEIASTASNLLHVATTVLQHLRDLAIVQVAPPQADRASPLLNVSSGVLEHLAAQASQHPPTRIAQLFDRFSSVVERAAHSTAPRLVIEMGLLDLVHAEPMQPLGDLVERLHALESGRGPGAAIRSAPPRMTRDTPAAPRQTPPRAAAPSQAPPSTQHVDPSAHPSTQRVAPSATPPSSPREATSPASAAAHAPAPDNPYWKLLGMQPGAATQPEAPASSSNAPPSHGPPPSSPARDPSTRDATNAATNAATTGHDFQLEAAPRMPASPNTGVRLEADPQAGCPSSRCLPKDSIPWREMEPLPAFESLMRALAVEDALGHAVFMDMGLVSLTEESLTLACPRNSFAWQQLESNEQMKANLQRVITERFGEPLPVRFVDQAASMPSTPSLTMVQRAREEAHAADVADMAREHAAVRGLVQQFDAQIAKVRPLRGPAKRP